MTTILVRKKNKKTSIIEVPRKLSLAEVKKIVRNPVLLSEDEGDYQYSQAAIRQGGKAVQLSKILKRYGRS
jgi:hypothetical protein